MTAGTAPSLSSIQYHLFSQSLQDGLWHTFQSSRWHFLRDEIRSTNHPFYKGFCHIYQVQEHRSLPLIHLLFIWISVSTWRCSSAATTFFRAMYLLIPRLPFGWGQESMKPVCESERERMEKKEKQVRTRTNQLNHLWSLKSLIPISVRIRKTITIGFSHTLMWEFQLVSNQTNSTNNTGAA